MSGAGGLDLRYPIGGLFVVLGVILGGYGVATMGDTAMYARSADVNINLWWGVAMLLTGIIFLALAARGGRASPTATSPEGQATEERERRLGLEH